MSTKSRLSDSGVSRRDMIRIGAGGLGFGFFGGAFEVQGEEFFQDLFVGQIGDPAVGGGDSSIKCAMKADKPSRLLTVQVRQRPLSKFRGTFRINQSHTIWETRNYFWNCSNQICGKKPSIPYSARARLVTRLLQTCTIRGETAL